MATVSAGGTTPEGSCPACAVASSVARVGDAVVPDAHSGKPLWTSRVAVHAFGGTFRDRRWVHHQSDAPGARCQGAVRGPSPRSVLALAGLSPVRLTSTVYPLAQPEDFRSLIDPSWPSLPAWTRSSPPPPGEPRRVHR